MRKKFDSKPSIVGRPANWSIREKVFRAIAREGAVQFRTAPRIAGLLKLDGAKGLVTINNHLRALREVGLIEEAGAENRPGRGRPSTVWGLTALGELAASFR